MNFNLFISRRFSIFQQTQISPSLISTIKALVHQWRFSESLRLYTREKLQFDPIASKFIFPPLLKACASLSNLCHGKTIHASAIVIGLQHDPYVATSLINMYVKCDSFDNAVKVFVKMLQSEVSFKDVSLWNSMIDGYFSYGFIEEGVSKFRYMQELGVKPDGYSLSILLGIFNGDWGYLTGKQFHGFIIRNMFDDDPFVAAALIYVYSSCGKPMDAWCVLKNLGDENTNIVLWNSMIRGFCDNGLWRKSLDSYIILKKKGFKPVSTTFSSTLIACSKGEELEFGMQIHGDVMKTGFNSDSYVCTSLLTMYARCGLLGEAEEAFDSIMEKEIELWNAMISAYVSNDCVHDALEIYNLMKLNHVQGDSFTISNLLACCSMSNLHDIGRKFHGELIKRGMNSIIAIQTALLTMYSKCGSIEDAYDVFDKIKDKDLVAWGSMISGFTQNKKFNKALDLFKEMTREGLKKPDSDITTAILSACAGLEIENFGFIVHGFVIKIGFLSDPFVGSSLIDFYSKSKLPIMANDVFTELPLKNLVVWNAMISCYCHNSQTELSSALFPQILHHGLIPDSVSITTTLSAVSSMSALMKGKIIHGYKLRFEIPSDTQMENAFIDMYTKCGLLKYAQKIFENMNRRNLVTFNSMISGFGSHGNCLKAIDLFNEMIQIGIKPDELTFLSLISSCNHSGLIEQGLNLFRLMGEHEIEPKMEHYVNIVALLGGCGQLYEAYDFIKKTGIENESSVWLCLLSASRLHQNVEIGELAANNLIGEEPNRGSDYVQLLNLYGEVGWKEKAANLRGKMREKGLKKRPGCSWIEVRNKVEVFFSGDSTSPWTVEIHETLKSIGANMRIRESYEDEIEKNW